MKLNASASVYSSLVNTNTGSVPFTESIKRSSIFGARSRSTLLAKNWSGAPIFAPPIEKESAPAPAPKKLECAPISIYTVLKVHSLRNGLPATFLFCCVKSDSRL